MKSTMSNPDSVSMSQSTPVKGFAHDTNSISEHHSATTSQVQQELFRTLSFKNPPPQTNITQSLIDRNRTSDMKPNLHRTFREIPFDIRERVVELVTKAELTADEAKKRQLSMNKELLNLRRDYYQTDKEVSERIKKRDLYLNQIILNQEKLGALEDDAESRRVRALKNAEAISRLSRTNKSLVDAFSKLYDDGATVENSEGNDTSGLKETTATKQKTDQQEKGQRKRRGNIGMVSLDEMPQAPSSTASKIQDPVIATSNEKLRERLLQVAKEHNRVVKNVEVLEIKVEGLRSSVRFADRRNRQLKHELDELRESASLDGSSTVHLEDAKNAHTGVAGAGKGDEAAVATTNAKKPKAQRAANTSRLNNLLSNTGFDAIAAMDGIRHLDALLQHIVATPSTMSEKDVAIHLCNRFICHVFQTQSICIFLVQPGGRVMHRYSTNSKDVKVIPLTRPPASTSRSSPATCTPSIAEWVLRRKEFCSLSFPAKHNRFRADVDQPPGINGEMKRLLSVPLCDLNFGTVVGAIHMVNKVSQNKFSVAEEQYAIAYGELAGAIVSSSVKYRRLGEQSERLCSLIQAPLQLLDSFQTLEKVSLAGALHALEETLCDTLHCSHAKAFLIAPSTTEGHKEGDGEVEGKEEGVFLTTLEGPPLSLKASKRQSGGATSSAPTFTTKLCPLSSSNPDFEQSIAAYTINTQRTFQAGTVVPTDYHDYAALHPEGAVYNPQVDMSPPPPLSKKVKSSASLDLSTPPLAAGKEKPSPVFYCVPIINLQQQVIGCLQASPSAKSPPLQSPLDPASSEDTIHTITFQDAMGWVGYLLSSKITYLMTKLEQKIDRHGFFLEPLSLTQGLKSMDISLAPDEPSKHLPRCVSSVDIANQILDWDRSQESLKNKPEERSSLRSNHGNVSGNGSGSKENTARTTPEKANSPTSKESKSKDEDDLTSSISISTTSQKKKEKEKSKNVKEVKDYVAEMRDLQQTIEQLRLDARQNRHTAGARAEQRVHEQLAKEYDDKLQAELSRYQQQVDEHSSEEFKNNSEAAQAESRALEARLVALEEAGVKRAQECEVNEERRQAEQQRAREEQRVKVEEAQETAQRHLLEIQQQEEEKKIAAAKQQADDEAAAKQKAEQEKEEALKKIADDQAAADRLIIAEAEAVAAAKEKAIQEAAVEKEKAEAAAAAAAAAATTAAAKQKAEQEKEEALKKIADDQAAADRLIIAEAEAVAAAKEKAIQEAAVEKEKADAAAAAAALEKQQKSARDQERSDSKREADRLATAAYERELEAAKCWEECLHDDNSVFYYNTLTEESVWDAPESYKPLEYDDTC